MKIWNIKKKKIKLYFKCVLKITEMHIVVFYWFELKDMMVAAEHVSVSARKVKMIVISENTSGAVYYSSFNCKPITMWGKNKQTI